MFAMSGGYRTRSARYGSADLLAALRVRLVPEAVAADALAPLAEGRRVDVPVKRGALLVRHVGAGVPQRVAVDRDVTGIEGQARRTRHAPAVLEPAPLPLDVGEPI